MARRRVVVLAVLALALSLKGAAQGPLFEAISIKESTGTRIPAHWEGARFLSGEIPLQTLLIAAYQVPFYQLTDLPEGALVLARVRADGSWTASAAGPFAPDDRLVVLDGAAVGPAGAGTGGRQ